MATIVTASDRYTNGRVWAKMPMSSRTIETRTSAPLMTITWWVLRWVCALEW